MPDTATKNTSDWLRPPGEREGLQRYIETLRERFWLIAVMVVITTGIAILYVVSATKMYTAESDLLITPVSGDDPVLSSLGLISASADPTRDVETASRFVTNIEVANAVSAKLESSESGKDLLKKVTAVPVAGSNIVAVTAESDSPQEAKELADAFATESVNQQTEQMHEKINSSLERLEAQIDSETSESAESTLGTEGSASIQAQVAELKVLSTAPNPTIDVQTHATVPTAPSSPKKTLSVIGGIFAGLILGVGVAFLAQALDPRLRREDQLRRRYNLPVLARIPREGQSSKQPIGPERVSPVVGESYRTLRATLIGLERRREGNVILVTGSSASEGKTTTAVNLASSLTLAGKRVILIESDLRHPVLGGVLGLSAEQGGVVSVLLENQTLEQALIPSASYGPDLQLLLADFSGGWIADLFSIPTAAKMVADARRLADYVIIDSPPLNEVVDALPLARMADAVILIARLGVTKLDKLGQLAELLDENGVTPVGFTLIGTPRPSRGESHYYGEPRGRRPRRLTSRSSTSKS
jgi:capsular exopolysaccharide synthesis family protein